jgi:hypothetical protein
VDVFQQPSRRKATNEAGAGSAETVGEKRSPVDAVLARKPVPSRSRRLLAHEGAFVLEVSLRDVRNMMRRGELRDVGCDRWRRLDPEELAERVRDRPLALAALTAILDGRLRLDRAGLDDLPVALMERWESFW